MIARRYFQFSLRAFLVATAIFAVWLGWATERTRRRGRAIDAIVAEGGEVYYQDDDDPTLFWPLDHSDYNDHFWADFRRTPINVSLGPNVDLDANMGHLIAEALPLHGLGIDGFGPDHNLQHLIYLNDRCIIELRNPQDTSIPGLEDLKRRLPKVEVVW